MNNVVKFTGNTDWSRDKIIDHLERCQMAAAVTMPAEDFENLLTQVLRYVDDHKTKEDGTTRDEFTSRYVNAIQMRAIEEFVSTMERFANAVPRQTPSKSILRNEYRHAWKWGREFLKQRYHDNCTSTQQVIPDDDSAEANHE